MLFLANFGLYVSQPDKAKMLAAIATGLFILPYFLFSALAGQLADAIDKARLIRWIKATEVAIMGVALAGFRLQSVPLLLLSLFAMGMHSTLFGPVKYSILPQHLRQEEIIGGTGLIEGGTFLAILGGQLLAGVISAGTAGLALVGLALLGFVASLAVPTAPAGRGVQRVDWNIAKGTIEILKLARSVRGVWLSILAQAGSLRWARCWCRNCAAGVGHAGGTARGGHGLPDRVLAVRCCRRGGGQSAAKG